MFIKEISLKGFKQFAGGRNLRLFLPGVNIIVGDKSSGKTTLLEVIEFMFNNKYANINENEDQFNELRSRVGYCPYQHLINVSIYFDNSDATHENLPKEFTITRITTSKTDEYAYYQRYPYLGSGENHFDKKEISRKEFVESLKTFEMDLYSDISIIKQEEIIEFATTSDKKRLDMLLNFVRYKKSKEVKQNESNALIEKSDRASVEVNKCHDKLEEDLCYEKFEMEDKKLTWIKEKFLQLEKQWKNWLEKQKTKKCGYAELKEKLDKFESELTKKIRHFKSLKHSEKELTKTMNELKDHKASLETSICNSKKNKIDHEFTRKKINEEIEFLNKEIAAEEKTIESMKSELFLIIANVEKIKTKYQEELWELDCLHVKLRKYHEPVSEEDGDKVICKIMKDWRESFGKKPGYLKRQRASLEGENAEKEELMNQISLIKTKLNNLKASRDDNLNELKNLRGKIRKSTFSFGVNSAEIEEVSKELELLQHNYEENREKLVSALKCDVMHKKTVIENALESFNKESKDPINVSTYHGFVIDCFQNSPDVEIAVLMVASYRLFHFVFDYEKDAMEISKKIGNDDNLSFISLNSLTCTHKTLPNSSDAYPLITKIEYAPVYEKLVKSMFDDILICKNDQVALELSIKYKVTCISLRNNMFFPGGVRIIRVWNENAINQISIYRLMSEQLEDIKNLEKNKNELHLEESSLKNSILEDSERLKERDSQQEVNKKREVFLKRELNKREFELQSILVDDGKEKNFVERLATRVKEFELKLYNNDQDEMTVEEYRRYKELKVSTGDLLKEWKEKEKIADELNKKITLRLEALDEMKLKIKSDLPQTKRETVAAEEEENDLIKSRNEDLESTIKKLEDICKKRDEQQMKVENFKKEIEDLTSIKNQQKNEVEKLKLSVDKNDKVTEDLESEYNEVRKLLEETLPDFQLQERVYDQFVVINDNLNVMVKKFIPSLHVQLIFMTHNQQYTVKEPNDLDFECFTGVDITFFESEDRPAQSMNVLPIKQRAIITLALFLAIQKSNSTPVVLCDEIDQALHSTHRQVLGTILKEMSSKAQILFTTSQPELLQVGDNFYRTYKKHRVVEKISKKQALNFITQIQSGKKAEIFKVIPAAEKVTALAQLHNEALQKLESQCYSALMNAIAGLAKKNKCPSDSIINPIAVREMSQQMPINKKEMSQIRHVRKNVFAKCGNICLKITIQYAVKRVKLLEEQKKEKEEAINTLHLDIGDDSSDDST